MTHAAGRGSGAAIRRCVRRRCHAGATGGHTAAGPLPCAVTRPNTSAHRCLDSVRCRTQALGAGTACQVTLRVPAAMRAPIYLYYELDNYYQNHRRRALLRSLHLPEGAQRRRERIR